MGRGILTLLLAVATYSQAKAADYDCAYDPARTHLSRIIAADSTNGAIYGQVVNIKADRSKSRTLGLRDHEIVLTFDDGPLAANTNIVLQTLDKHCVKATFFSVGRMALSGPKVLQEIERKGHTIGTHTWSHPRAMDQMPIEDIKLEIEKGFAAVSHAVGKPIAPFVRFPGLRDSPEAVDYLASRNISVWSVDVISGDTDPGVTPAILTRDTVARTRQLGRGIILFHDIKKNTAEALDGILTQLEQDGFKVVHVVTNTYYQPNPELMAKANVFRTPPGAATITGHAVASASSGEEVKDGSVDIMRTEWIDLKRASEQIAAQQQGQRSDAGEKRQALPEAQEGTNYSANSWTANGRVR